MLPRQHLIYGTLFTILFYIIFPQTSLLFLFILWLSTWFLIDLDHPIYFTIKYRSLNPVRFWQEFKMRKAWLKTLSLSKKRRYKSGIIIFHGIEFLIVLAILSRIFVIFSYILIGFVFHLLLDCIQLYKGKLDILTKVSLIYTLITNKKKRELILK